MFSVTLFHFYDIWPFFFFQILSIENVNQSLALSSVIGNLFSALLNNVTSLAHCLYRRFRTSVTC
jgi:hypothetical protein